MSAPTSYAQAKAVSLLKCIETYQATHHGVSPSYRDLCQMTGIRSVSNIHRYLRMLVEMGRLAHYEGQARSLVVLEDGR